MPPSPRPLPTAVSRARSVAIAADAMRPRVITDHVPAAARRTRRVAAMVLALATLSVIDWAWTIAHLQRDTPEANPILLWALETGGLPLFSAVKLGVTAIVAGFLLAQAHRALTHRLMIVALGVYGGVIAIHVATELAHLGF